MSNRHVTVKDTTAEEEVSLFKPFGKSLPNDQHFNSWLTSLSSQLINKHLVTMVIWSSTSDVISEQNKQKCSHVSLNSGVSISRIISCANLSLTDQL